MSKLCEIIKVDLGRVDPKKVGRAAAVVKAGGVIIYPTDTIYGLGGSPFVPSVVQRIGQIKARATAKAMLLLIADLSWVDQVATEVPAQFHAIAKTFWPGPLTIILKAKETIPSIVTGHIGNIGIRLPDSRFARALVAECGVPLISTSANLSGEENILHVRRIIEQFKPHVDLIVDAGDLASGTASTVISLLGNRLVLIREGQVRFQDIQALGNRG
jgi:L-threonylcarbamoyladenylate synthase